MPRALDPVTRTTRAAANLAAAAVLVYAVLWTASTQIAAIRSVSAFADDPWDAVATATVLDAARGSASSGRTVALTS